MPKFETHNITQRTNGDREIVVSELPSDKLLMRVSGFTSQGIHLDQWKPGETQITLSRQDAMNLARTLSELASESPTVPAQALPLTPGDSCSPAYCNCLSTLYEYR